MKHYDAVYAWPGGHPLAGHALRGTGHANVHLERRDEINMPNLVENVMPTKHRATLVLRKGADHAVESVQLRKV